MESEVWEFIDVIGEFEYKYEERYFSIRESKEQSFDGENGIMRRLKKMIFFKKFKKNKFDFLFSKGVYYLI